MHHFSRHRFDCAIVFVLALGAPGIALAQPTDPAALASAEKIFNEATEAMKAGKYDIACPKLEQVTRLVPSGLGAKEQLAECYEKDGKLASAWALFSEIEGQARQQDQVGRAEEAARRSAALKPKLSTLTIDVPEEVRKTLGLTITRNGVLVADALWGNALPVDAEAQEIIVSAPGRKSFRKTVSMIGEHIAVHLAIPLLVPASPEGRADTVSPVVPASRTETAQRPWQLPTGVAVTALGVGGIVTSAVLGGLAISRNDASKADGHCKPNNECDTVGFGLRNETRMLGDASTASIIAGGAMLAGGIVLLATTPRSVKEPERRGKQGGTDPKMQRGEDIYRAPIQVRLFGTGMAVEGTW